MTDPAVRTEGLLLRRGAFRLGPVDARAPAGTVVGILGAPGSGKSTLLDILAGVEAPDAGRVWLSGVSVVGRRLVPAHRRGVSYLTQESGLWRGMTAGGNVEVVARAHGTSASAARVLDALDARSLAPRDAGSLSGGEARRIALARALVVPASLLLLDEPGSHLGHGDRERAAWTVVALTRERGTTLIVTGHEFADIEAYEPSVLWMLDAGELVVAGDAGTLVAAPLDRRVAERVGFSVFVPARFEAGVWISALGRIPGEPSSCRRPELAWRPLGFRIDPSGALRGSVVAPTRSSDGRPGTRVVLGNGSVVALARGQSDAAPGTGIAVSADPPVVVEGREGP
jgi:ABC-type multidrug transport system ATPase subunit